MVNQINRVISSESLAPFHFKFLACSRSSDSLFFANSLRTSNHMEKAFSRSVEKSLSQPRSNLKLLFQVGQVTWNDDLAKGAEDWAKHLAANNLFQHAPNLNVGENLYWSSHKPEEPCTKATKAFYGEVKYYDYDKPGFSLKTGHFTQVN